MDTQHKPRRGCPDRVLAGDQQAERSAADVERVRRRPPLDSWLVDAHRHLGQCQHNALTRSKISCGILTGSLRVTGVLSAKRGTGSCCGLAEVLRWTNEAPFAELHAVGDGTPVAEAARGKACRMYMTASSRSSSSSVGSTCSAVGADGGVDALLVRTTRVPRTRAPDQVGEVGEARARARTPSS